MNFERQGSLNYFPARFGFRGALEERGVDFSMGNIRLKA
jgi:hypothetical protein